MRSDRVALYVQQKEGREMTQKIGKVNYFTLRAIIIKLGHGGRARERGGWKDKYVKE
jgi:hypothetical protein